MTATPTRNSAMPVPAPIAPPKVIRQRRMRPGLLGLAVLLIALGGLGAAFAITSVKATGDYLAVARSVPQGTTLTADDLATVQVAGGAGLASVPASQRAQVVGKRAAVTLMPGSLLTMSQLTDKPLLTEGQQQVALGLRANQVPARRLLPGDKVILVGTPEKDAPPAITRYDATVIDMALDRGNATVYLALRATDVAAVVLLAADDRIAVVLVPGA
ncbi:SAF domain-containing protein [Asanoa hainanensis]|uniref:SAF domain-containing protein n=2 Tax=Asanoa hainanensis TaxID=560556 RepID=A0A239MQ44_9ACTN|nr:SAF domain-containing protein [Asanoa hainanensis]